MQTGHWRKLVGAVGMAALLVTACGGASQTASQKPAKTQTTSAKSGSIVDGLFEEPNTLNPILGPSMTYAEIVEQTMFRNLFILKPDGTMVPDLASVVPTVKNGGISKDGLTYTFHLKHGLKWSDGQPLTVKDVYETYKADTMKGVTAASTLGWSDVKSFKTIDSTDFQLTLKKPFSALLVDTFSSEDPGIIPWHIFKGMNAQQIDNAKFNHDPTATDGPFEFKSWVPGASITVVPNPNWYGPKPKAKRIVFKIVPNDNTLLAQAQSHALNVYYFDPIEQLKQLQAIKGAKVHFSTSTAWEMAVVNLRNPILQNVNVRKALEYAINRQALVQKVWQGHGVLLAADQNKASWDYDPNLKPYPYSPKIADQLLTQAGWIKGKDGYRYKNGKELEFTYSTTAGNPWRAAGERLIQFWFKQVGVKLNIRNYPANAFFATVMPSGHGWDFAEYEAGGGADPVAAQVVHFTTGAAENYGDLANAQIDKLFKEQAPLVTRTQRLPYLYKVEKIMHDTLPDLWLYTPESIDTSINMAGYTPNVWEYDTWNCYDWAPTK